MDIKSAQDSLSEQMGDLILSIEEQDGSLALTCAAADITKVLDALKTGAVACEYFSFMTAVDYLPVDAKDDDTPAEPGRLELVYHVANVKDRINVFVTTTVPRPAGRGTPPRAPSICAVYAGANWFERECAEMFGVDFEGHPDPRHLLLPDDWVGYPLLKDYDHSGNDLQYTPEKCWPEVAGKR